MKTYLTADNHFSHHNILRYCRRPFGSVEEMDAEMVRRWNAVVGVDELVVHLGDFALARRERMVELVESLNGYKVLLLGNHDRSATAMRACGFDEVHKGSYEVEGIRCVHDPGDADARLRPCVRPGETMLCGHVHGAWRELLREVDGARFINVGVDVRGFAPVPLAKMLPGFASGAKLPQDILPPRS